jgi:hypothetical protein
MTAPHPIPLPSGERGKVMGFRILLFEIKHRITQLSSSPLVGEGGGEGGIYHVHPHLNPPH